MSIDVSAVTGCRVRSRRPLRLRNLILASAASRFCTLQSSFYYSTRGITNTTPGDAVVACDNGPRTSQLARRARLSTTDREWIWRLDIFETTYGDPISVPCSIYHEDCTVYLDKIIWYLAGNYVKCIRCLTGECITLVKDHILEFFVTFMCFTWRLSRYNISF